jgi:hypothetical protein
MFGPGWIRENAHRFDLVHVHFGFEWLDVRQLRAWVQALDEVDRPLVVTVHDLRNPHLVDNTPQERLQDVLLPAADAVVTLTPAAAAAIRRRWDRDALVLPHPHVVDARWLRRAQRADDGGDARRRVGVHLKSLRPNLAGTTALEALELVGRAEATAEVDVRLHNDIDGPGLRPHVERLQQLLGQRCTVRVSDYLADEALWGWLDQLDVVVLPYRFGTHSGWIEMAKDLGVASVIADLATYRDQGATATFPVPDERPTAPGMAEAVHEALDVTPVPPAATERVREAAAVVAAHRRLYEAVLARGRRAAVAAR